MGTLLFWSTWVAVGIFYTVTTRAQRQRWFWLFWTLAIATILLASTLNLITQGYPTYL